MNENPQHPKFPPEDSGNPGPSESQDDFFITNIRPEEGEMMSPPQEGLVVGQDVSERRAASSKREFVSAMPALVVSLVLHGLLIFGLATLLTATLGEEADGIVIRAKVERLPERRLEEPDLVESKLEEPDELLEEPDLAENDALEDFLDSDEVTEMGLAGGLRGSSGVRAGRREDGLGGVGDGSGQLGELGEGFRDYVDDMRRRGLEVVFVVDATASMDKFIVQARAAIDAIIEDLATVVPSLRVGIVAYRDHSDVTARGGWVTHHEGLGEDRYRIHNFLLDLEARGGGDFEEAVDEGLKVAMETLEWRDNARRVILLVGDAPVHPDNESAMHAMIRNFVRDRQSLINVLYTGVELGRDPSDKEKTARSSMEKISITGKGILSELVTERNDLRPRILEATFGKEWFEDVNLLLSLRDTERRQRIIDNKLSRGDRDWFISQLRVDPVLGGIVDGCLELFDGAIAQECYDLLIDPFGPIGTRAAALYILKRKVWPVVAVDFTLPMDEQLDVFEELGRRVRKVPFAGGIQGRILPPRRR